MIAYMPEIYDDELLYSWFCRYYAHMGYPTYVTALDDLLNNKNGRIDYEFWGHLNGEARSVINSMYDIKKLIRDHTMYLQYARFSSTAKRAEAMKALVTGEGNIHNILVFPISKNLRYLKYCPICAAEDREKYGETYWHRSHQLRNLSVCPIHNCRLIESDIEISTSGSPRMWPAEEIILDNYECGSDVTSLEIGLAQYAYKLFQTPLSDDQPPINRWLISKLEGTEYISSRGQRIYISKLYNDFVEFYSGFSGTAITAQHQLHKIFTCSNSNYFAICQLAVFLQIPVEELSNPTLPEQSQTERFDNYASELRLKGKGCYRSARELRCCPSTAIKCLKKKKSNIVHNHSVRTGMHNKDWDKIDSDNVNRVETICKNIYSVNGGRPHRVTENAVVKAIGWPDKRLQYLPKCRAIVCSYKEPMEEYWAREAVWAYLKLKAEKQVIHWKDIRTIINIKKEDFYKCKKYIIDYADDNLASEISDLI